MGVLGRWPKVRAPRHVYDYSPDLERILTVCANSGEPAGHAPLPNLDGHPARGIIRGRHGSVLNGQFI